MKILYDDIVDYIKEKFPEYQEPDDDLDDSMIFISFFSNYLANKIAETDIDTITKAASLVETMVDSEDISVRGCLLDEIVLSIYDKDKEKYAEFTRHLSSRANAEFDKTIINWNAVNQKKNKRQ